MKKIFPTLLSFTALALFGALLYKRLDTPSSTQSRTDLPPAAESAGLPPPATDAKNQYPMVNSRRLVKLAGKPYNGLSYKIENAQFQQMVAEQRQPSHRMPANEGLEQKAPKKGKSKAKKAN
ncbi:MAG: hypothetical protein KF802_12415 [Bdellovibrionaceae bacterium]|nr:hypothetical protein [Pseudobdellovibrionaceae bacterium]MBX3034669.1 hypothetical protein [Pseudobdellovibrionaceae bacterium]